MSDTFLVYGQSYTVQQEWLTGISLIEVSSVSLECGWVKPCQLEPNCQEGCGAAATLWYTSTISADLTTQNYHARQFP